MVPPPAKRHNTESPSLGKHRFSSSSLGLPGASVRALGAVAEQSHSKNTGKNLRSPGRLPGALYFFWKKFRIWERFGIKMLKYGQKKEKQGYKIFNLNPCFYYGA
jgi:hypothetical protein